MKSVLLIMIFASHSIVHGQDCLLDSTFANRGRTVYPIQNPSYGATMAVQADGKTVLFASTPYPNSNYLNQCLLIRYTFSGQVDLSFGNSGSIVFAVNPGKDHMTEEVTIQPDGKILAVGLAFDPYVYFVARFNSNGTADTSFGVNGKVITSELSNLKDIEVQVDGKIVLAGSNYQPNSNYDEAISLIRLNNNGSLDSAFGKNGKVRLHLGSYITTIGGQPFNTFYREMASSLVLQNDGKLLVASVSYGNNCQQEYDEYGWPYLFCDPILAVTRFLPGGELDSSFGIHGTVSDTSLHPAFYWDKGGTYHQKLIDMALQPDDKIVVAVQSLVDSAFVVQRFHNNGTLDRGFGTGGRAVIPLTNQWSYAQSNSLTVLPDGKILVAGRLQLLNTSQIAVIRLNSDGNVDNTAGTSSKAFFSLAPPGITGSTVDNQARKIVLFGNRAIIAGNANWYRTNSGQGSLGIIRFDADFRAQAVPIAALGSTILCDGDSVLLQTTVSGTVQWNKDGSPINGANGREFAARAQGSYSVTAYNDSQCGESEPVMVQVLASVQKPQIIINGNRNLCRGQAVTLSIGNVGYNLIQWYKDGTIINGANQIDFTTQTAGTYKVLVSHPYYCSTTFSDSVVVQVEEYLPIPSIDSSGPLSICEGENLILSTAAVGKLQWYLNQMPIPGASSSLYQPLQSGIYSVSASTGVCASYSSSLSVKVTPLPKPTIYWNGSNCSVADIFSMYQWYVDSVAISGATDYHYQPVRCGNYMVRVRTGSCEVFSPPISVLLSKPKPVITWDGNILNVANQYKNYQWYLEGVAIGGAIDAEFKPVTMGKYSVKVTSHDYCTASSEDFNLRVAVANMNLGDVQVNVYPNPATDYVNVELDNASVLEATAVIYDANGRMVIKKPLFRGVNRINLQTLASGLFALTISDGTNQLKVKLIHQFP